MSKRVNNKRGNASRKRMTFNAGGQASKVRSSSPTAPDMGELRHSWWQLMMRAGIL